MKDPADLRDDGPLASRLGRVLARGVAPGPLAWLVPPLVRAFEYGGLIALTAAAEPDALPACFAFLAAIAFHHYDGLRRDGSGRPPPPRLVGLLAGGWELRLVAAGILAALGALEEGLVVGAVALGALFAGEVAASWIRAGRRGRQRPPEAAPGALE